jgi:hypothetical protein
MKKLKELKCVHNVFVDAINELDNKLQNQLKKVKQEYQKNVIDEKLRLLIAVCNGEGLEFDKIKAKYLKPKELSKVSLDDVVEDKEVEEEELLDKIEINGKQYYYEAKDTGVIYDLNSKPVGVYKNGKFILN